MLVLSLLVVDIVLLSWLHCDDIKSVAKLLVSTLRDLHMLSYLEKQDSAKVTGSIVLSFLIGKLVVGSESIKLEA